MAWDLTPEERQTLARMRQLPPGPERHRIWQAVVDAVEGREEAAQRLAENARLTASLADEQARSDELAHDNRELRRRLGLRLGQPLR